MQRISRQTIGKAVIATLASVGISVLVAGGLVPLLGGSYDGIGMWLSLLCPVVIAFPASAWQFHRSETLRKARDEMTSLHLELDRMHSSLMQAHAALERKARQDAMTGGLNRETFFTDLETASASGRTGALLLADADHFKRINDRFGHQTGDEALAAIAAAIASQTGVKDFWGRIGGEEFAIFLDGSGPEEARAVAESIRRGVEAADLRRETGRVPVSISIGGICVSSHFSTRQAIGDADRLLYRAKRGGRNRVVLDNALDDTTAA